MNFPLFIAKRYLISKKKQNIINIISGVAIAGVSIGTIALIVVLSVYNGFDTLINSLFNSFDPDLKITAVEGKTFNPQTIDLKALNEIDGIAFMADILEESAILKYGSSQGIAKVKGVSANYSQITQLDSLIYKGELLFEKDNIEYAVVGLGVALNLGIKITFLDPIHIYAAKKGKKISQNLPHSLNKKYIFPSGIFSVQEQYDSEYILVPLNFARSLFDTPLNISAIELKLEPKSDQDKIQQKIKSIVGEKFHVKNKYQQQELVYKVMNSEKWAIYFILLFILIIASFNILGSMSMLIIDKKNDIAIMRSMGASQKTIRLAFLIEGWLISLTGAVIGLILGSFICWLQIHFELLKFPGNGSFAVSAYPVEVHFDNIVLTFFTVIIIGFIAAWFPVRYISGKYLSINND